ncbi:MAG: 16S rRNA (guanine(527)-N(7))-methyltransferase RsmG [Terriglobia bacterium]
MKETTLSDEAIGELLRPYGVELTAEQTGKVRLYLSLLMRWNGRINLTGVRDPRECITRHFGESLMLSRGYELTGRLLDVGSGAGFPGLALKIAFPSLKATLLEPVAKKRAFLKEVARQCGFEQVDVCPQRFVDFCARSNDRFEAITARAVGKVAALADRSMSILADSGRLYLWLTREQARTIVGNTRAARWINELQVPRERNRIILVAANADVPRETQAGV